MSNYWRQIREDEAWFRITIAEIVAFVVFMATMLLLYSTLP